MTDFTARNLTSFRPQARPHRCEGCPFKSRTCGSKGPIDSPIVIVGESPGQTEIAQNLPFVGRSGEFLDENIPPEFRHIKPYYTNSFVCLPPSNKKKKDKDAVAVASMACSSRLLEDIRRFPRKVIIALGNGALWGLTGDTSRGILSVRGQIISSTLAEHGIVPTTHPAYLLRGKGSQRLFKRDISLAYELAVHGKSKFTYIDPEVIEMENASDVRELFDIASKADYIASDIETSDLHYMRGHILSQGFCIDPRVAYIVPPHLFHLLGSIYDPSVVRAKWIWHNGDFDVGWLRYQHKLGTSLARLEQCIRHTVQIGGNRDGYQHARVNEDTILLSYTREEISGIHDLEQVSSDELGAPNWKAMKDSWLPKKGASYANIPPNILYRYQGRDLSATRQIFETMRPVIGAHKKMERLYTKTLIPASDLVTWVKGCGFAADRKKIAENRIMQNELIAEAKSIVDDVSTAVLGYNINPNSWQQVQALLYKGGLDLANGKILATDKKTLEYLTPKNEVAHPAITGILNYRSEKKALSVGVDGVEEAIQSDGRVHSTFLLYRTTTGRLASRNPNMQNVDRDSELRNEFVAEEGNILFELDLNQAELRSLAALSGDEILCKIYTENTTSIHKIVSQKLFGKDYNNEEYMRSKMVTFGIVYGREARSLAMEFKISEDEAQKYIDDWMDQFPQAKEFIRKCRRAPRKGQILQTPFGRQRRFGIVSDEAMHETSNQAANFPHQSIASDIMLHGAMRIRPYLELNNIRMVDLVHDCMMLEMREDEALIQQTKKLGKEILEGIPREWGITRVPFISDAKRGRRWGDFKKDE